MPIGTIHGVYPDEVEGVKKAKTKLAKKVSELLGTRVTSVEIFVPQQIEPKSMSGDVVLFIHSKFFFQPF